MRPGMQDRVTKGVCLLCDSRAGRRGLCGSHYFMFRRKMLAKPTKATRKAFATRQVKAGRILAAHAIYQIRRENPFE